MFCSQKAKPGGHLHQVRVATCFSDRGRAARSRAQWRPTLTRTCSPPPPFPSISRSSRVRLRRSSTRRRAPSTSPPPPPTSGCPTRPRFPWSACSGRTPPRLYRRTRSRRVARRRRLPTRAVCHLVTTLETR